MAPRCTSFTSQSNKKQSRSKQPSVLEPYHSQVQHLAQWVLHIEDDGVDEIKAIKKVEEISEHRTIDGLRVLMGSPRVTHRSEWTMQPAADERR